MQVKQPELGERPTEALERQTAQLREQLDEFCYAVSHDLKEPLRGIGAYARFLLEDYGERFDGEGRQMLEALPKLTARMTAQLDALRQLSESRRKDLSLQSTDLRSLVDEVLASLTETLERNRVRVSFAGELPAAVCDAHGVRRVFRELVSNGIRFSDKPTRSIEIGADIDPRTRSYYVRDDGIGIPESHLSDIFRIFRRLHGRDAYGGGTGAGLTIARSIVERHGGELWVECEPGLHTTFRFTLPGMPR